MADNDDAQPPRVRGFKHRINQVFAPGACRRIEDAVRYVHSVMCNATLLLRYRATKRALESTDHSVAPSFIDEKEVLNAIRAVQTEATVGGDGSVGASTSTRTRRAESTGDATDARSRRDDLLRQYIADYAEMTSKCLPPLPLPHEGRGLSVSLILNLAAKQYAAAVISNVRYRFRSYVCCALGMVLRSKATTVQGTTRSFDALSPQ